MSQVTSFPWTFADGQSAENVIHGSRLMDNYNTLKAAVNSIDETQVDPTSDIMLKSEDETITGTKTFDTNPVFNSAGISDAALSSNIMRKDSGGSGTEDIVSGYKQFTRPIKKLQIPTNASPDTTEGAIYVRGGKVYAYRGSAEVSLEEQPGEYTGTVGTYSGVQPIDQNTEVVFMAKAGSSINHAYLKCFGYNFPAWAYTELGAHTHGAGSLALASGAVNNSSHTHDTVVGSHTHSGTFADSTHTHSVSATSGAGSSHTHTGPSHTHSVSGTSGAGSSHTHDMFGGSVSVGGGSAHTHSVTDSGHSHAIDTDAEGLSGATENATTGISLANESSHNHAITGFVKSESSHTHSFSATSGAGGTGNTGSESSHTHSVSATSGAPSATASVSSTNVGTKTSGTPTWSVAPSVATTISGTSASAGYLPSGKTLNATAAKTVFTDSLLQVYISQDPTSWGSAKTFSTTDLFTAGTSEQDMVSEFTSAGIWFIRFKLNTVAEVGGTLGWHLQFT